MNNKVLDGDISPPIHKLTQRECEVLDKLIQYNTLKTIAADLGITVSAVDQRLKSARVKLGAANRNDAVRLYQALVRTCVESTYRILQVPSEPQPDLPLFAEAAEAPTFMLRDSEPTFPQVVPEPHALELNPQAVMSDRPRAAPLPEVWDEKFGRLWRVVAIPVFALAIVMLVLAIFVMAKAMNQML